jgi:hypothetical protein
MISRLLRHPRRSLARMAANTEASISLELETKGVAKRGNDG